MAKYHIKSNGEPGKCSAFLRPCPLGEEAEHYPSSEAAREAYEEKMSAAAPPVLSKNATHTRTPPREITEAEETWAKRFHEEFYSMAAPEELEAWAEEPPNSFRWRLAKLHEAKEKGDYSDYDFANVASGMAAGERSGLSRQLRSWAHDLTVVRSREAQAKAYEELLEGLPLEGRGRDRDHPNPFTGDKVEDRRLHTETVYLAAMEKAKGELVFADRLANHWDDLIYKVDRTA